VSKRSFAIYNPDLDEKEKKSIDPYDESGPAGRNDYEHKHFTPFNYDQHGDKWDVKQWPLARYGEEQSPIALHRVTDSYSVKGFRKVTHNDSQYEHNYKPNTHQVKQNLWTGTTFQVSLSFYTDYMKTLLINFFN
jgi:hypothetical protein